MTPSDVQARLKARVWQAIAQSGVDLSSLGSDASDRLVAAVTEAVEREFDALLANAAPSANDDTADLDLSQERILWEGRPFLSLATRYVITSQRLRVSHGILGRTRSDIELVRIQDLDQSQSIGERLLHLGDIRIQSHDPDDALVVLENIADPDHVMEILRGAVLEARDRFRLSYREEM
ncbi:MAG: PH domain-containing protein [Ardenticatenales bacterium]